MFAIYDVVVHPTAEISKEARIGAGTKVWHQAQVREGVQIGQNCIIGKGVYIDFDVQIGHNVKVQNYASVYHGATIEDGVFIGPYACLTNDKFPRAITPDGRLKGDMDWEIGKVHIKYGAAIGTGAAVLAGVTVGRFALVGAGAVVTKDIPDYGLVVGNPGRLVGYVCKCGRRLRSNKDKESRNTVWYCDRCEEVYNLPGDVKEVIG
jgi:UDP-2-acetamido-3-amino-2,3-dideoxy-glucuronate N-acetyltransferase